VRCLSQVLVVYFLSFVLGVQLNFSAIAMLGVLLIVMLGAACFSIFSIEVDALRGVMLLNGTSIYGYGFDTVVLVLVLIALTFIGGRLYRQIGM
jgi:ABC-2 type transport system permease protein